MREFSELSLELYTVLKKVIDFESVNSEELVQCLIEKDGLDSVEVTKFLLQ